MDEELKTLVRRNLDLTRENNKLLKKIRRSAFIGHIMTLIWWAIIIGVPVAVYYYVLQPYYQELTGSLHDIREGVQGAEERLINIPFIGDFFADLFGSDAGSSPQAE